MKVKIDVVSVDISFNHSVIRRTHSPAYFLRGVICEVSQNNIISVLFYVASCRLGGALRINVWQLGFFPITRPIGENLQVYTA